MDGVGIYEAQVEQFEILAFYHQALDKAAEYRLSLVQRKANDHQVLAHELPNLWEVVQQSYERRAWERTMAFRDALQPFLDLGGYWQRSLVLNEWACEAAQALGDASSAARWTHDRADILHQRGEYSEAETLYRSTEETFRGLGEIEMALKSRHMRSLVVRAQGRLAEAERLCETTIAEAQALGLDRWVAHPLYVRGLLARDRGDPRKAKSSVKKSLALLDNADETAMIAQCWHFLGEAALLEGDLHKARMQLEESLTLSRQVGILRRVAATLRLLGDLAQIEERYKEAERVYREALDIASQLEDRPQMARLFLSQAQLMGRLGQSEQSVDLMRAALSTYEQIGDSRGVAGVSLLLARLYLRQRRVWLALRVSAKALQVAGTTGWLRPRVLTSLLQRSRMA